MTRDIIDQIDAATGCHQCEGALGDSPSDMFCSEWCQEDWYAGRSRQKPTRSFAAMLDHIETNVFIAGEAFVQFGQSADRVNWEPIGHLLEMPVVIDHAAQPRFEWRLDEFEQTVTLELRNAGEAFFRAFLDQSVQEEPSTPQGRMRAALEARRNRNTGPRQQSRAPRRIDPRRQR